MSLCHDPIVAYGRPDGIAKLGQRRRESYDVSIVKIMDDVANVIDLLTAIREYPEHFLREFDLREVLAHPIIPTNFSNRYRLSCGPGDASG